MTDQSTPSAQLIAQAAKEVIVTDSRGRSIKLRKPGVLAQFRLVEAVGPETAKNAVYMNMVMPIIYVAQIDGDPVSVPTTKREVEALIQRLDEDGVVVVSQGVQENYGQRDMDDDKAALGN